MKIGEETHSLSLEQRKQILQNKFENDLGENTFLKFELKNKNKEEKIRITYDEDRQVQPQKAKKTFISKNRVNNHNTPNQITQVQRLIIESKSKNYDQISLKTGVKVSSIKKKIDQVVQLNLKNRLCLQKLSKSFIAFQTLKKNRQDIAISSRRIFVTILIEISSCLNVSAIGALLIGLLVQKQEGIKNKFFSLQYVFLKTLKYDMILLIQMRVDLIKNPFRHTFWHQNEQTKSQQMMFIQRIILQSWLQAKDMAFFAIRQKKMHLMEVIFLTSSSKPSISLDLCLKFKDKFVLLWIIAEFIKLSRQQRIQQIAPLDTYLQPITAPDESN
ncbi:hypothetical protein ABPG72_019970 [Tetrahymena utriculariae]